MGRTLAAVMADMPDDERAEVEARRAGIVAGWTGWRS